MHYDTPPQEVLDLIKETIEQYYPELRDNGVTVDATMAYPKEGAQLKCGGYPALAFVKINSLKHRIKGLKDSEITLDGQIWETLTEKQRRAILDHELHHLKICLDKDGGVKYDDAGRPKLSLRRHDYQMGWFREVALRHGPDSPEQYQAKILWREDKDTFFSSAITEVLLEEVDKVLDETPASE